jgi:nicotinamide-nucleotide amidase
MFPEPVFRLAENLLAACRKKGLTLTLAESCTGGLIAGCVTAVAGSSDVFERGFVTYTNQAKEDMLGVPHTLLVAHGAVSEEVARAMAEGAMHNASASLAAAVTGIAGPGGGTETKPVGLVHISAAHKGHPTLHQRHVFPGDRQAVRLQTVEAALTLLQRQLDL